MTRGLSYGDLKRLQGGMQLLLSPFDYRDSIVWRRTICDYFLDWVHSDGVHVTLSRSANPPMVGQGRWGPEVQREYITHWHDNAEIDRLRDERGLVAWVRHDVMTEAEFRRTTYFKEFCVPIGFNNSAGAVHRFEDGDKALLHFTSCKVGNFRPGGRTFRVLQLLQPALMAGAAALKTSPRGLPIEDDSSLPAMALVSIDGRLIHATPELRGLFSDGITGAGLRFLIREVACETGRLLRERSLDNRCAPRRTLTIGGSRFTVSSTFTNQLNLTGGPACVVVVMRSIASMPNLSTASQLIGLTPRETDVARLLANGLRNREIATVLKVSEHTARRHTEQVLRKLGVRSRAAIALALTRLDATVRQHG